MFIYILGLFIYIFNVYLQKFSKILKFLGPGIKISVCLQTLECLFTFCNVYLHFPMFVYILGLFIYISNVYLQKFSKILKFLGPGIKILVCLQTLECLFTFCNVCLHSGFVCLHFPMFVYILGLFIYIFNVYLQKFSKISWVPKFLTICLILNTYLLYLPFILTFITFSGTFLHFLIILLNSSFN